MNRMSATRKMVLGILILVGLALLVHLGGARIISRLAAHLHGGQ